MGTVDYIIIAVIALIIGGALAYVIKETKRGKRCIGCPDSEACQKASCGGNCSCCSFKEENKEK